MSPYAHIPDEQLSDEDRRKKRRITYERVLGMIDAQTSQSQPALVGRGSLFAAVSHSNLEREQAEKALQAAIENGDVIDWHGSYALATEESLLRVIETEVSSDFPRKLLIGKCNRMLTEARRGAREGADDE